MHCVQLTAKVYLSNMKLLGISVFATIFIFVGLFFVSTTKSFFVNNNINRDAITENISMPAAIFFTQSTTSKGLRETFKSATSTTKKLNVLIVPGHEPNYGGAEYRDIKERDLNADLALLLAQYLVEDGHYNVALSRGKEGWNPHLEEYYALHAEDIKTFTYAQKSEMLRLIDDGRIIKKGDTTPHNRAPTDVALRLYGINKWANERGVDIVIHVHFNDSAPRPRNSPGEYNGFTIYTPDSQYSNSQASNELAKSIFKRLSKMFPVSNLPIEDQGVVEEQELIAVGSNNSVDAASILIEYGYIYEPHLSTPSVRGVALRELAFQTYIGLADFFGEISLVVGPHESTLLPYDGTVDIKKTTKPSREVFALQAALIEKGFYPPNNLSNNDCPMNGLFGPCTKTALAVFQREHNIKGENGFVGEKTRNKLRKLFEPSLVSVK